MPQGGLHYGLLVYPWLLLAGPLSRRTVLDPLLQDTAAVTVESQSM